MEESLIIHNENIPRETNHPKMKQTPDIYMVVCFAVKIFSDYN